ncbi:dienelactone hydrolase family protein [Mycolicibacterium sp. A43C]
MLDIRTPLQRYIAEEIATGHVDGLLSRREALRRLALLGVGTAAATALGNRPPEDMVADLRSGIAEVRARTPGKRVAAIGFYGELDQRVNATEPVAAAALDRAGLVHELVVEQGANHAFFNDTGDRYDPRSAEDAWQRTLAWPSTHVG